MDHSAKVIKRGFYSLIVQTSESAYRVVRFAVSRQSKNSSDKKSFSN